MLELGFRAHIGFMQGLGKGGRLFVVVSFCYSLEQGRGNMSLGHGGEVWGSGFIEVAGWGRGELSHKWKSAK